MADESAQAAAQAEGASLTQAGGPQRAVPQPVPSARPGGGHAAAGDALARAAALRREAAQLEASAQGPGTAQVKVGPPHDEFHWAGLVIGTSFTTVPAGRMAGLQRAAAESGVTLTTEES